MSPDPSGLDIALRLAATAAAGAAIGFDRSVRGRTVGLRTVMLVGIAAALAMVETNLLLSTRGKPPDGFAQMDPMRLPLGVLSGIGFIGAGAIVRRGELVSGVTTAATLWLITVIGLVLGAGDYLLGAGATLLALVILLLLKRVEAAIRQERNADLFLRIVDPGPDEQAVRRRLHEGGLRLKRFGVSRQGALREIRCDVSWRPPEDDDRPAPAFNALAAESGVLQADWNPKD